MSTGKGASSGVPTPHCLASALEFAGVVPVVIVRGKDPGGYLGKGWQLKATRDPDKLRQWFATWPNANVGVVPSGEMAPVDVDDPESFARLQAETVATPPTPRFFTGGAYPPGRERLLFAHPGEPALAGMEDTMIASGVQLRVPLPGKGALMSLVPPSVHPDTGEEQEWTISLDEAPLAQLPGVWLDRMRRKPGRPGRSKGEWTRTVTATHGPGSRHDTLMSLAGRLVPVVGTRAAYELLLGWNDRRCRPPKPPGEIADLVRFVARKEAGR